jgi:hypothetical protein
MAHITLFEWEKSWQGSTRRALKGYAANTISIPLAYGPMNGTATVRLYVLPCLRLRLSIVSTEMKIGPFRLQVVVKCEAIQPINEQFHRHCPRSDFLILNSPLPRLPVEVNSTTWRGQPGGYRSFREHEHFLDTFCQMKNFVLCAIFMAPRLAILYFSSKTNIRYVVLCI